MSSHEKALEKKKKHVHKMKDGKCEVCNMVKGDEDEVDEKGVKAKEEQGFGKYKGAKNNDTENDK